MLSNEQSISRILVIRLSSMGDVVLTSKLIRNLRKNFKNSIIKFITNKEYEDLIKYNPNLNEYLLYEKYNTDKINELINNLREFKPDLIIDLQNSNRSKELIKNLSKNTFKFDKRTFYKLLLVYSKINKNTTYELIPDLYCKTIKLPNFEIDNLGLEIWLSNKENYETIINRKYYRKNKYKIAIAPGATYKTKRIPEDILTMILKNLSKNIGIEYFLIGGKEEIDISNKIEQEIDSINYTGKLSILETTEIIDQSDLLITNDTGIMHIASARRTLIIVFYGCTIPNFGFVPYHTPHIIFENDLWCRPCSHIGRNFCPLIHFNCMKKFNVIEISDKIIAFLNNLYKFG
uniref:Glycosyltransferase family 9 protein n=1 Tax=candidate division CPR3 bacterium TaxID=2268181 RepID=A0A7C4M3R9_UNCC3